MGNLGAIIEPSNITLCRQVKLSSIVTSRLGQVIVMEHPEVEHKYIKLLGHQNRKRRKKFSRT